MKSYLTDTLATFDNAVKESGLDSGKQNAQADVTQDKLDKLKAGLSSAKELGNTATEKATATHKFSQY